jgi:RHS repeat-associated protein
MGREWDGSLGLYHFRLRHYDPQSGRFLQPDAADASPARSAYEAFLSNPLIYVDPHGTRATHVGERGAIGSPHLAAMTFSTAENAGDYRDPSPHLAPGQYGIFVRSYAPFDWFGGGYEGDDRGASLSADATSRMHSLTVLDTKRDTIQTYGWASRSTGSGWWPSLMSLSMFVPGATGGAQHTAGPFLGTGSDIGYTHSSVKMLSQHGVYYLAEHMFGSMPLAMSPDIDVHTNVALVMNEKTRDLEIRGWMTGDAFPNAEVFLQDPAGHRVFVHSFATHGDKLTPYTMLWGDPQLAMGKPFEMRIALDESGNFTGVRTEHGTDTSTLHEWNKLWEGHGGLLHY